MDHQKNLFSYLSLTLRKNEEKKNIQALLKHLQFKFEIFMDPNELAAELKGISDKLDIWVENTLTAIQTKVENQECMLKDLEGILFFYHYTIR